MARYAHKQDDSSLQRWYLIVHCSGAVLYAHTLYAGAAIGHAVSNAVLHRTKATSVNLIMVQEVILGIALMPCWKTPSPSVLVGIVVTIVGKFIVV